MFWVMTASEPALALELDHRPMAGVGLGRPGRVVQSLLPRQPPHLGVGHVVVDVRGALGLRVLGPEPFGPRKSGMPLSVEMPAPVSTTMDWAACTHERAVDRTDGSTTEISAIDPGYGRT